MYKALTKEELSSVIDGRATASRVPVLLDLWVHPWTFGDREQAVRKIMNDYCMDAQIVPIRMPGVYKAPEDDPEYRWVNFDKPNKDKVAGIDEQAVIEDWSALDSILEDFPDPNYKGMYPENPTPDGRYRLAVWFFCLFERHWELRGMTNALMDFYTDPDKVHKLYSALTDFYMGLMERAKNEMQVDGILTSDDIGTQTGPFFSPEIFNEFFKPYYKKLIDKAHSLGMHFWLHSCGNIEKFIPEFIEIGLDVIHPIQKYAMNEKDIAKRYSKDICVWAGFDVQRIIPWGTPDEVRQEVRYLMDTYYRPEGKFMITAGNGVNGDCPLDSMKALYDESFCYGIEIVSKKQGGK